MRRVIRIQVGNHPSSQRVIQPLFDIGIPGYFDLAPDIPPELLYSSIPGRDYYLVVDDITQFSATELESVNYRYLRPPTAEETLWATAFMELRLANAIAEKPVRFLHEPWHDKQLTVKRAGLGYRVELVRSWIPDLTVQAALVIA